MVSPQERNNIMKQNASLLELMIECPETGKLAPIGKAITLHELRHLTFVMEHIEISCPHCGKTHIASEERAWIQFPRTPES